MQLNLRVLDPHAALAPDLLLGAFKRLFTPERLDAALASAGVQTRRTRKLPFEIVLWLCIAMSLEADVALTHLVERLTVGLRFLWPDDTTRNAFLPTKSAISQRRYQLRARPLAHLFAAVCQPLATPQTPGAFLGGLRLMAIDGHTEDVPDTPANAACFGRPSTGRGVGAFPQVRVLTLCEVGTHAIVAAGFWPVHTSEHHGARRLLRSVTPGMLVMWDRGLHEYALLEAVQARGAHVLTRLPANIQPELVRRLKDGSRLMKLRHPDPKRQRQGEHQLVRVIEYTFTDPQAPGHGPTYRLVTTLLDPKAFPARTLAGAYHQRWEHELVIDEVDTHQLGQHLLGSPLRSRKPVGVIQELYGVLLAHYAICTLMYEAALREAVAPTQLSFLRSLRIIQDSVWQFQIAAPALWEGLYRRLLDDLVHALLPERQPRAQPRVVKRKMVRFPLKRLEHQHWPQPTRPYWRSLTLI